MNPTQRQERQAPLSPEGLADLLRLLVQGPKDRIRSAVVDGRTVWIKRLDAERRPAMKVLHGWLSPLLPWPMLRSSRLAGTGAMVEREVRKNAAFAAAGFPSVSVLHRQAGTLVLSSAAAIVQNEMNRLRPADVRAHDALLIACASALGKAHNAGLCHGRPHPRDMIVDDGQIGFLDFEEAPEEAMPLVDAQARDLWLLFLQICGQALLPDTPQGALDAYLAEAPSAVLSRLAENSRIFGVTAAILRKIKPFGLGGDARRLLKASEFLYPALLKAQATNQNAPVEPERESKA